MNAAPTFERVYRAIKQRVLAGEWRPGQRLDLALLATDLAASITPVRDALNRLVGEHLLEAGRGDGFVIPLLTEADLRDLYVWRLEILLSALRLRRTPLTPTAAASPNAAEQPAELFAAIAAISANREHAAAIGSANDRLHAIRSFEIRLFPAADGEIDRMTTEALASRWLELRRRLVAFHRLRIGKVAEIMLLVHRDPSTSG